MPDKRPPVFFTIAAIKHEPMAALAAYMPAIQDDLRKRGYAGPFVTSTISIEPIGDDAIASPTPSPPAQKTFTLFSQDRTSAFTFNDQGIFAHHTTKYAARKVLFEQFRMGLELFHRHVELQTVLRVGVRMLDLIRPADSSHVMSDYVHSSLLGFQSIDCAKAWTPGMSTMDFRFVDGDAEVIAKFDCLPDGFGIQSDLFATLKGHALPTHVTGHPGLMHGILDIDAATRSLPSDVSRPFDIETIMVELGTHKDRISKLFRAAVTPLALSEWGLV